MIIIIYHVRPRISKVQIKPTITKESSLPLYSSSDAMLRSLSGDRLVGVRS